MTRPALLPSSWRRPGVVAALLLALGLSAQLASCGGDVGTGGTGAPTSYSAGRIAGFGSVIVNGVHYDDSASTLIVDDDGNTRPAGDLALGMTVRIDAGEIKPDATGALRAPATAIRFGEDIAGPVTSVQAGSSTLAVLGQTVTVDLATVFGGYPTGLAGVVPGDLVKVFAFLDTATGRFKATRIEKAATLPAYTLQGQVASLDAALHRFSIGSAVIDDSAVSNLPTLSDGLRVRVQLGLVNVGGAWPATRVSVVQPHVPAQDETTEIEGLVDSFASLSDFTVDGVRVNAGGPNVQFINGSSSVIADGARVQVEGSSLNGVLVATQVDVAQDDARDTAVELEGSLTAVDAVARTFVLRGQTVGWNDATVFTGGGTSQLVVGAQVEMHGHLDAAGGGVVADTVAFDH